MVILICALAITILTIIVALILYWYLSPVLKPFPRPSGNHAVGTISFSWFDHTRPTEKQNNLPFPRTVSAQIWYPSEGEPNHTARAPYCSEKIAYLRRRTTRFSRLPGWLLDPLTSIKTFEQANASIFKTQTSYPIIFFSPGRMMGKELYSILMQELASNGFVVVGIDHAHDSLLTFAPNGRAQELNSLFEGIDADATVDKKFDSIVHTRKEDILFVLDKVIDLNNLPHSPFFKLLDTSKIGIAGHSLGGRTALELCLTDPRFKAGVNMDGDVTPKLIGLQMPVPFLTLLGEWGLRRATHLSHCQRIRFNISQEEANTYTQGSRNRMEKFCEQAGPLCNHALVEGTTHHAFSDFALLKWPLSLFIRSQSVSSYEITISINTRLRRFFDKTLTQTTPTTKSEPRI